SARDVAALDFRWVTRWSVCHRGRPARAREAGTGQRDGRMRNPPSQEASYWRGTRGRARRSRAGSLTMGRPTALSFGTSMSVSRWAWAPRLGRAAGAVSLVLGLAAVSWVTSSPAEAKRQDDIPPLTGVR